MVAGNDFLLCDRAVFPHYAVYDDALPPVSPVFEAARSGVKRRVRNGFWRRGRFNLMIRQRNGNHFAGRLFT